MQCMAARELVPFMGPLHFLPSRLPLPQLTSSLTACASFLPIALPRGSRRNARSLNEKPTAGQPGQTKPGIPGTLRGREGTTGPAARLDGCRGSPRPQLRGPLGVTSNGGSPTGERLSATHPNRGRRGCGGRQLRQQPLQERREKLGF